MNTVFRKFINIILSILTIVFLQITIVDAQEFVKSDFPVSNISSNNFPKAELSVNTSGNIIVIWENVGFGGLWFKEISSLGTVIGDKNEISAPIHHNRIKVAHSTKGDFMILYGAYGSRWSNYFQLYKEDLTKIGEELNVNQNHSEFIDVSETEMFIDKNNQTAILLSDDEKIMVVKLSETGELIGDSLELVPEASNYFNLEGIMTPSGHFILIWNDLGEGNIFGSLYSDTGSKIGDKFQVSDNGSNSYIQNIDAECDTAGNFSIVWIAEMDSGRHIFSQLFNAEAEKVGTIVKVTEDETKIHSKNGDFSMDMDINGNFAIAWPDSRDSGSTSIYIQQLTKYGEKIEGNYLATSINFDSTTMLSTGDQKDVRLHFKNDTIFMVWANYNKEISTNHTVYANIQKWIGPDYTDTEYFERDIYQLSCYPNPSSGIFQFAMNQEITDRISLSVYDCLGRIVIQQKPYNYTQKGIIDLSAESDGLYFLRIDGKGFSLTHNLIKTK